MASEPAHHGPSKQAAAAELAVRPLRRIGILGGMGPEATILLQRKLIVAVDAADDADHIPLIIDMNTQVPSRIAHLITGDGADPGPTLADMARRLENAGAEALAMPCNTAHHYAAAIADAVSIPFLDMVELSADLAARTLGAGGSVGMLASPAVRKVGLFEKALERRGLSTLWPANDHALLEAIRTIKAKGTHPDAKAALRHASDELASGGASFQLIACSEFSLIADCVCPNARATDTLDVLVAAIRDFSFSANCKETEE
ncbi:aspartate/glutamate racemase family protein [Ruegeria sediminis]|uniref:Aspartate/glutamate racemase family protein n=1 Tax=Ruegeria sediminis TaxID=2583820 RepID=A0ABY2X0U4_9RHOB|nr:amino acid racemase [Ruegeria sediminis]TMV08474.1 aspartate/glutamate racemase family protein [Ruegeria sediminis]